MTGRELEAVRDAAIDREDWAAVRATDEAMRTLTPDPETRRDLADAAWHQAVRKRVDRGEMKVRIDDWVD